MLTGGTRRDTVVTQLQMVQDTNTILEQWRSHYEREIVHLQLAKVEIEGTLRQKSADFTDKINAVSAFSSCSIAMCFAMPIVQYLIRIACSISCCLCYQNQWRAALEFIFLKFIFHFSCCRTFVRSYKHAVLVTSSCLFSGHLCMCWLIL